MPVSFRGMRIYDDSATLSQCYVDMSELTMSRMRVPSTIVNGNVFGVVTPAKLASISTIWRLH